MAKTWRTLPKRFAVRLLAAPIHAYRCALSPMLPPSCRFQPTCSCYALEALSAHGPLTGSWLALRRLARCHPLAALGGSSGYDPVPGRTPPR
jgi:putative membrane protein insertion efficiency factor